MEAGNAIVSHDGLMIFDFTFGTKLGIRRGLPGEDWNTKAF
jgi:hypothetical protein